jgi:hypothetical protein
MHNYSVQNVEPLQIYGQIPSLEDNNLELNSHAVSSCRDCPHFPENMDKYKYYPDPVSFAGWIASDCKQRDDCPLKISTVLPDGHDTYRKKTKTPPAPKKQCPVPGCANMIKETSLVCQKCWPRTNHRMRNGVPRAILFKNFKLPNNWRELYGTQEYKLNREK